MDSEPVAAGSAPSEGSAELCHSIVQYVARTTSDLILPDIWLAVRPHFDPLRETAAFKALLERVNLEGH